MPSEPRPVTHRGTSHVTVPQRAMDGESGAYAPLKKKGLFRGCRIPHRGHAPIPGQSLPCMARHMTAIHRALTKGSPHIPCKAYNIHRMGRVGRVIVSVVYACQRPYSTGLTHAIVGSFVFWPIYL